MLTSTTSTTDKPRSLGVSHCTCCGVSLEIVGPLRGDGCCGMCGHGLDAHNVLVGELRRFIQPWMAACREREISRQMMASAWDALDVEIFHSSEGVPV